MSAEREPFLAHEGSSEQRDSPDFPEPPDSRLSIPLLFRLARILSEASSPRSTVYLLGLVPATVAYVVASYFIILAPGDVYAALVAPDPNPATFVTILGRFAGLAIATTAARTAVAAFRDLAANSLRSRLSARLHTQYFTHSRFLPLCSPTSPIDNPDQRLAEDITKTTATFATLLAGQDAGGGGLLEASLSVVWYTAKTAARTGWRGVALAYACAASTAVLSVAVLNWVSPVVFAQDRCEADLRFEHARLRDLAGEVGMTVEDAVAERERVDACVERAVRNYARLVLRQTVVLGGMVQTGFGYGISVAMYGLIGAVVVIGSRWEGVHVPTDPAERAKWISQTASIFMALLWAFTMMIQLGKQASNLIAYTTRVADLMDALSQDSSKPHQSHPIHLTRDRVTVTALTLHTPDLRRTLTTNLSFSVSHGEHALVIGPSGCGKSSLLRTLRGIHPPCSFSAAYISRPPLTPVPHGILFLPQRPYLLHHATLLDQTAYPSPAPPNRSAQHDAATARAAECLARMGLARTHIVEMNTPRDWATVLSTGEKQRVALARVLYHRPAFAALDECTSALEERSARDCVREVLRDGIGVLEVRHGGGEELRVKNADFIEYRGLSE